MFGEVEISGGMVEVEFWDQCLWAVLVVAAGLAAASLGPPVLWGLLRPRRKTRGKGPRLDGSFQNTLTQPQGAARVPAARGGRVPPTRLPDNRRGSSPSQHDKWAEKRKHLRRTAEPKRVLLADRDGQGVPLLCWVTNRSRGGLGIVVDCSFAPGTVISVRPADTPEDGPWVQLAVRNCHRKGTGWYIGCQFTKELPWSVVLLFG